jgi:hypothetical protein
MSVTLKRCELPITWVVTPASARVEAPKRAPWGVPTTIKVSREGYLPLSRQIELPKPERCEGPAHHLDLALSRAVLVSARSEGGRPLQGARLKIGGLLEPKSGETGRPPGLYRGELSAERFEPLSFTVKVPPCQGEDYESSALSSGSSNPKLSARCFTYELNPKLRELSLPDSEADQLLKRFGLLSAGAGLALLSTQALALMSYQESSYSQGLSSDYEGLERGQIWAYSLIGSGALIYGLGLIWPSLSPAPARATAP